MKKYLYFVATLGFIFFCGISRLNAAQRIDLVTYSGGIRNTGNNSSFIRNITSSNEETGEMVFELKFKNSLSTEVMFVIDDSTTISSDQSTLLSNTAENIATELLDNYSNIKFGVYTIHPYSTTTSSYENEIQSLTDGKQSVLSALNTVETSSGEAGQDIVSTLSNVENEFSVDCENKMVFLLISGFDTTNVSTYLDSLESLENENITLVTLLLDFKSNGDNSTAISSLFGTEASPNVGSFYNKTTAELTSTIEDNLISEITGMFPTNKTNIVFNETFSTQIYNNFNLTIIDGYDGSVSNLDNDTLSFTWTIDSLSNNNDATLTYKLNILDTVTNVEYGTQYSINGSSKVTVGGTEYSYDYSPIMLFTDETVNPKTGVINIVIPFLAISGMSILAYVFVKSKEKINEI